MKCQECKKEVDELFYAASYPLLITKSQEYRGVFPSGDFLIRVCSECNGKTHFYNPEYPPKVEE